MDPENSELSTIVQDTTLAPSATRTVAKKAHTVADLVDRRLGADLDQSSHRPTLGHVYSYMKILDPRVWFTLDLCLGMDPVSLVLATLVGTNLKNIVYRSN
ncbi:hypothetical protein ACOSQ4_028478 [Xanthoceras sorbifolium]